MKVSPHFLRLYYKTARRYNKLAKRLRKQVSSGKFQQQSEYVQKEFIYHLRKLKRRLFNLKTQIRLAAATGVVALALTSNSAEAQTTLGPFVRQERNNNPLREPLQFNEEPSPVAVDLDHDGDQDIVVGEFVTVYSENFEETFPTELTDSPPPRLRYFRNKGTPTNPDFEEITDEDNPFNDLEFGYSPSPSFIDWDNDGDLDMLVGQYDGTKYYKNVGTPEAPIFEFQEDNPFPNSLHGRVSPHLVDLDQDGDIDVMFGEYFHSDDYFRYFVYYENDGEGNFSQKSLQGLENFANEVSPTTMDVNNDGYVDILILHRYGYIGYYENDGENNFEIPEHDPFYEFSFGAYPSASPVDFDGDGDLDLIVGSGYLFSSERRIQYLQNQGDGTFKEIEGLENPFGGVFVDLSASPLIIDVDNDSDYDALVGGEYLEGGPLHIPIKYYKNVDGKYVDTSTAENPIAGLNINHDFAPSYVDLDDDGDKDLVGSTVNHIQFFKNEGGIYQEVPDAEGPFNDVFYSGGETDFADLDGDGDYDMLFGKYGNESLGYPYLVYFKNIGTPQEPDFQQQTGDWDSETKTGNPFNFVFEEHKLFPRFVDIDHDGDMDVLAGEGGYPPDNEFLIFENIGTPTNPQFVEVGGLFPQGSSPIRPAPNFADFDGDGDLDLFLGYETDNGVGQVSYYVNTNTPPTTTINTDPIVNPANQGSFFVDQGLTISDIEIDDTNGSPISEQLVYAEVRVTGFSSGDGTFSYTIPVDRQLENDQPEEVQPVITVVNTNGVLIFRGKAKLRFYEELLRSVAFNYNYENQSSGRTKGNSNARLVSKAITITVKDIDFTNVAAVSRTFTVGAATPPPPVLDMSNTSTSVVAGKSTKVNLNDLLTGSGSFTVTNASGLKAKTSIDNNILTIDYTGVTFQGSETITIRASDQDGNTDDGNIQVTVTNTSPVIMSQSSSTGVGGQITVDLNALISDADNNINYSTLRVVGQPSSGAPATINANKQLVINYSGINFSGSESVRVEVCDFGGTCVQNTITITITNSPPVIEPEPVSTMRGATISLDLLAITSDVDDNLDPTTFEVVSQPISGASARIQDGSLIVDYNEIRFRGRDELRLKVCDLAGACTETTIYIEVNVTGEVKVYNAVAPRGLGDNRFMRIINLPARNKVSIYNRWGDRVFEVEDYNSEVPGKRFEGNNDNGNVLPSGTYFYKIEIASESQPITGYLTLKQ